MYKTLEEPEHTPVIKRYAATHWTPVSRQVALLLSLGQRQADLVTHHHPLPVSHVCSCLTVIAASVVILLRFHIHGPNFPKLLTKLFALVQFCYTLVPNRKAKSTEKELPQKQTVTARKSRHQAIGGQAPERAQWVMVLASKLKFGSLQPT